MRYDLNKILAFVSRIMGTITEVKKLKSVTNDVYKIKNNNEYIVKIYLNRGLTSDLDLKITKRFGDFNGVMKRNFLSGRIGGVNFVVVEYIKGKLLSNIIYRINPSEYYRQLCNFLMECGKIKTKKYGRLKNSLDGSYKNWLRFLLDLEEDIYYRSNDFEKLVGINLCKLKEFTIDLLKKRKICSVLIPVDLNLSNFIITKGGKVRAIEIGSWFAGDPLFPYCLLLTHAWKTPLYNQIIKDKPIQEDTRISLFYSLLESLSVISFNKKIYPSKLKTLKPFGNKLSFMNIMEEQKKLIGI